MTESSVKRDQDRCPTHPGKFLREIVLPGVDAPKSRIAQTLGLSRQTLYDILGERQPVTPDMAIRLEALFGRSAQAWLNMQVVHDVWHARRRVDVAQIPQVDESGRLRERMVPPE